MKIRGFEEVERINAWVLYYDANGDLDENMDYPKFIVKSGFEEKTLDEAIEEGLFDQNELELIYDLIEEYE